MPLSNWINPYPSIRQPAFARHLVATAHPLATQAGVRMLMLGGNAVDAAIATAAVSAIVEPVCNGLGSDLQALVWDGARLHALDATGPAPNEWSASYFQRRHGGSIPLHGWDSVTVPGAVAGWAALHSRFGRLDFAQLLAPAIEYAERGFHVSPLLHLRWSAQVAVLDDAPGFAEAFLPQGRAPRPGERFAMPEAAATLRRIAESGGRDFYEGSTAHSIVAHAQAHDAALTLIDLAAYQPTWVQPLSHAVRDYTLHDMPSPGRGIVLLVATGLMEQLDVNCRSADHPASQHLLIEAFKLAQATVDSVDRPDASTLLSEPFLRDLARRIDPQQAQRCDRSYTQGGATSIGTADPSGMMVCLVQSNHVGFGSGVVVPGTGVSLHNHGHAFSMEAGHPDLVAGGKRPPHPATPTFITHQGAPFMTLGICGGNLLQQGNLQVLARLLAFRQPLQAACDAPRWRWTRGRSLHLESSMPSTVREGLLARGHIIDISPHSSANFGAGQLVRRLGDPATDGYMAACDPRRDSQPMGF